jgi:hypothetical protein
VGSLTSTKITVKEKTYVSTSTKGKVLKAEGKIKSSENETEVETSLEGNVKIKNKNLDVKGSLSTTNTGTTKGTLEVSKKSGSVKRYGSASTSSDKNNKKEIKISAGAEIKNADGSKVNTSGFLKIKN